LVFGSRNDQISFHFPIYSKQLILKKVEILHEISFFILCQPLEHSRHPTQMFSSDSECSSLEFVGHPVHKIPMPLLYTVLQCNKIGFHLFPIQIENLPVEMDITIHLVQPFFHIQGRGSLLMKRRILSIPARYVRRYHRSHRHLLQTQEPTKATSFGYFRKKQSLFKAFNRFMTPSFISISIGNNLSCNDSSRDRRGGMEDEDPT